MRGAGEQAGMDAGEEPSPVEVLELTADLLQSFPRLGEPAASQVHEGEVHAREEPIRGAQAFQDAERLEIETAGARGVVSQARGLAQAVQAAGHAVLVPQLLETMAGLAVPALGPGGISALPG